MSSQEVVDFVNERFKTEAGKSRPLSAIVEEVRTGKNVTLDVPEAEFEKEIMNSTEPLKGNGEGRNIFLYLHISEI